MFPIYSLNTYRVVFVASSYAVAMLIVARNPGLFFFYE